MNEQIKVLVVIPARGGSKGVPRKNIADLAGKPLIAYSIEAALAAGELFHDVIVSTDDQEIADIAASFGAPPPFLRPDNLANDQAPMVPVVRHAIEFVEKRDSITLDWVMLLQPTAPLRTPGDLARAVELAKTTDCDSVISVARVFANHPILMKKIENGRLLPYCIEEKEGTRRQDYDPPAYKRNGSIYLSRRNAVVERGSIWGGSICPMEMPAARSHGVDSERDLRILRDIVASTAWRDA